MVFTFMGQVIGFFVSVFSAKYFGASVEMDAFLAAQTLPNYLSMVLVGGLSFVFVPIFVENRAIKEETTAWDVANSIITLYMILLATISILGILFSKELVLLITPGLSKEGLDLASGLAKILWPSSILTGLLAILTGLYQAYERFIYFALSTLIASAVYLLFIILFGAKYGIYVLAIGTLLSAFVNVAILLKILFKKYKFRLKFNSPVIYEMLLLQLPLLIASICSQGARLVDRYVASELPVGSISYISYADKIKIVMAAILGGGISITLFPTMALNVVENNLTKLRENISLGIRMTWLIVSPVIFIVSVLALPIITILFKRGEFTSNDTNMVTYLLPWFLFSIAGATLANITARTFYAFKNTKIIGALGIFEIVSYIIYMPLLTYSLGIIGIGISVMILWNSSFLIQSFILWKKYDVINIKEISLSFLKVLVASIFAFIAVKIVILIFSLSNFLLVVVGTIIGIVVYLVVLKIQGLTELSLIITLLKKSISKIFLIQ